MLGPVNALTLAGDGELYSLPVLAAIAHTEEDLLRRGPIATMRLAPSVRMLSTQTVVPGSIVKVAPLVTWTGASHAATVGHDVK